MLLWTQSQAESPRSAGMSESRAVGQHGGYLVNISLVRIHFRLNPYLRMQLLILVDDRVASFSSPPHHIKRSVIWSPEAAMRRLHCPSRLQPGMMWMKEPVHCCPANTAEAIIPAIKGLLFVLLITNYLPFFNCPYCTVLFPSC